MSSRRNTFIRTVAALGGDIATGLAMASRCVWLIEAAALGLFLSFLLWLIALAVGLAVSQYVVHPVSQLVLSDHKLDAAVSAAEGMGEVLSQWSAKARQGLRSTLQQGSAWRPGRRTA